MTEIPFTDTDAKYGWPRGLMASIWKQESGCGADLLNEKSGCRGHFQFKPATRDEVLEQSGFDAFSNDPSEAAKAAAYYLNKCQKNAGGSLSMGLAAYNWGPGNLSRKGIGRAPTETQNYFRQILGRVGQADAVDYTMRYEAGETSADENEVEIKKRRKLLQNNFSMSEEEANKFSEQDLLGSFFIILLSAILDGASKVSSRDVGAAAPDAASAETPTPAAAPNAPAPQGVKYPVAQADGAFKPPAHTPARVAAVGQLPKSTPALA